MCVKLAPMITTPSPTHMSPVLTHTSIFYAFRGCSSCQGTPAGSQETTCIGPRPIPFVSIKTRVDHPPGAADLVQGSPHHVCCTLHRADRSWSLHMLPRSCGTHMHAHVSTPTPWGPTPAPRQAAGSVMRLSRCTGFAIYGRHTPAAYAHYANDSRSACLSPVEPRRYPV